MKPVLISIAASGLLAAFATAQPPRYTVRDLGTLRGGTFSQASFVNNKGVITGVATAANGAQHAALWYDGWIGDFGPPAFGGPNSEAFGVNESGQADALSETAVKDPNGEDFCGYGTHLACLPFLWQNGVTTPLPTLGGNNGTVGQINNRGQIIGAAENNTRDPTCPPPQALDYEAVIWGPGQGEIRVLPPLPGDSVGVALWINDNGQAVGASGSCADTALPPLAFGPHAVLWEKDGSVHDLGNLGGTMNIALSINNQGQVVGASTLPGATTPQAAHAFLWTTETGIRDLGALPGDVASGGVGINDGGEVVGASFDASGNPRAFLWRNAVMTDLNTAVPGAPLFLLFATAINSRGEIVGFGATSSGDVHAFLATPSSEENNSESLSPMTQAPAGPSVLSDEARKLLQKGLRFGGFKAPLPGPR